MSDIQEYKLDSGKAHPFHIVEPSMLPMLSAFAAGSLAVGALLFMHLAEWKYLGGLALAAGFAAVLAVMWCWWRDVIKEAVKEKAHTSAVKRGFRYGVALFILSEVMFFAAFFWAFFNASLMPTEAIGSVWPPASVQTIEAFGLPFFMTMVLLLSGCTVTWAHHEILEGNNKEAARALAVTVGLGVFFTLLQAYEYHHASFAFAHSIYGSTFYMATGFHGFHVLVGTIFLAVCYFRTVKGHFTKDSHFGFEAAAWYWHFVDVVWLFLFTAVYWWGNG